MISAFWPRCFKFKLARMPAFQSMSLRASRSGTRAMLNCDNFHDFHTFLDMPDHKWTVICVCFDNGWYKPSTINHQPSVIRWIASPLTLKFQPARSHGPIRIGADDVSTNLIGPFDLAG